MFVLDMFDDIYNPKDFDVSPCSPVSFLISSLVLMATFPSRMVGDDDDEGALSDSDGHTGLAPDDLASK